MNNQNNIIAQNAFNLINQEFWEAKGQEDLFDLENINQ